MWGRVALRFATRAGASYPYAVCAGAVCGLAMLVRAEFLARPSCSWPGRVWRRPAWRAETAAFLLTMCVG